MSKNPWAHLFTYSPPPGAPPHSNFADALTKSELEALACCGVRPVSGARSDEPGFAFNDFGIHKGAAVVEVFPEDSRIKVRQAAWDALVESAERFQGAAEYAFRLLEAGGIKNPDEEGE